jgi:eukaryotic-like serine/threonine-protein kinase
VTATRTRLREGTIFESEYRVLERIGEGSMGAVYRVQELSTGDERALKLVVFDTMSDPKSVRRFEREAAAGVTIESPHIARTYKVQVDAERGIGYLVMEYAAGQNLTDFVRQRAPLDLSTARRLLDPIFQAMAAAHAAHVVHRDLKPENIRVQETADGFQVKVLDFGIAKALDSGTFTGTKPGLGTPLWTAPEQAKSDYEPHPHGDVWALGLIAFFVLTGRVYWKHADDASSVAALALELLREPIVRPRLRAVDFDCVKLVPAGFDGWFLRAVNRTPSERFADAGEAGRALHAVFDELNPAQASVERPRGGPTGGGAWLIWILFLTLFGFGYAIFHLIASAKR